MFRQTQNPKFAAQNFDESGSTTLEWTLLLAAIGIPAVYVTNLLFNLLIEYYRMMTFLNSLPFP